MKIFNRKGSSVLMVTALAGVLSALSYFMIQGYVTNKKLNNKLESSNSIILASKKVATLLTDTDICTQTFSAGGTLYPGREITNIKNSTGAANLYSVSDVVSDEVVFEKIVLSEYDNNLGIAVKQKGKVEITVRDTSARATSKNSLVSGSSSVEYSIYFITNNNNTVFCSLDSDNLILDAQEAACIDLGGSWNAATNNCEDIQTNLINNARAEICNSMISGSSNPNCDSVNVNSTCPGAGEYITGFDSDGKQVCSCKPTACPDPTTVCAGDEGTDGCGNACPIGTSTSATCCAPTDWGPATNIVCNGTPFTQTCPNGATRPALGTMPESCGGVDPSTICVDKVVPDTPNTCGTCPNVTGTDTSDPFCCTNTLPSGYASSFGPWSPSAGSICASAAPFTQTRTCSAKPVLTDSQTVSGTDITSEACCTAWGPWLPVTTSECDGTAFTQTQTCTAGAPGATRTQAAVGTGGPCTCTTWGAWTPADTSTTCPADTVLQTRSCLVPAVGVPDETQSVAGTSASSTCCTSWDTWLPDSSATCPYNTVNQSRNCLAGVVATESQTVPGTNGACSPVCEIIVMTGGLGGSYDSTSSTGGYHTNPLFIVVANNSTTDSCSVSGISYKIGAMPTVSGPPSVSAGPTLSNSFDTGSLWSPILPPPSILTMEARVTTVNCPGTTTPSVAVPYTSSCNMTYAGGGSQPVMSCASNGKIECNP